VNLPPRNLTDSDAEALTAATAAPDVAIVTPVVTGIEVVRYGTGYSSCTIKGSTPGYLDVANRRLVVGSSFDTRQMRDNARVVVLGSSPAQALFGDDAGAAVGQTVSIGRTSFRVIGVLRPNDDEDSIVLMPAGAARTYVVGGNSLGQILVSTSSTASVAPAVAEITTILSARHHIADPLRRDFTVDAQNGIIATSNQFFRVLALFVLGAASISLLVGAVGIANVMLVSVTERTREIGIRRVVGARRREIMTQFVIESAVLSGLAGGCGVIIGIAMTLLERVLIPRFTSNYGTPELSVAAMVVAFAVSVGVGVAAGVYPARRAARVAPVDALRYG
jgi:putative ABC transport system permease protein